MKPIAIPKLADHSEKLVELLAKRDAIGARIVEVERERHDSIIAYHKRGIQAAPLPTDPATLRVAELLGEAAPPVEPGEREKLAELAQTIYDLKRAHEVLDGRVRVERGKVTADLLLKVAPEYRRRIRAVADAYKAAVAAQAEVKKLTDELDAQDLAWGALGVVGPMPSEPARRFFEDALGQGFVTAAEIPQELRP